MGESIDGEDGLFKGLPMILGNVSALESHSGEISTLVLALLVLVMLVGVGEGDSRLLSSNVEHCSQNGESNQDPLCLQKVLLQLSIIHGKTIQSDTTEIFVTHVQEPKGAFEALHAPYRITLYKSDIYAEYPLTYLQSFNDNPSEEVISSLDCRDGHMDPRPDCGWPFDKDGGKVKDSQGFCCPCNTTGSLRDGPPRMQSLRMVEEKCNITLSTRQKFPRRRPGSAHCLRFSKKWSLPILREHLQEQPELYPTYQLGTPIVSISVGVVVESMHSSMGKLYKARDINSRIVYVQNQQSTPAHPNDTLKAYFKGDMEFNMRVPILQDQFLSIPMEEGKSERVSDADQWLTLPKDYFSLDGQECDRIGVSYKAFKFQANACDQPVQSCCGNQINAFAREDSQRMLKGEAPKYSFSQYGKAVLQDGMLWEPTSLNLHLDTKKVSILNVELQADDIRLYSYRSTGKILKAAVERLETGTRQMVVEVVNLGLRRSYFKIKVADCSGKVDIFPVEIVTLLVPAIASTFWLDLHFGEDVYSFNATTISCKVVLFDQQEMSREVEKLVEIPVHDRYTPPIVEEPKQIKWSTSSWCFIWCNNQQYKIPPPPPPVIDPCLGNCTKIFDAMCFVKNWCGQKLLRMIGIIISCIVGLFILFLLVQSGALSLLWECLSVCIGKTTRSAKKAGKSVARAQKKRQKLRMREDLREGKDMARADFLNEKLIDKEDEEFDKIVLGQKKGKKNDEDSKKEGKKRRRKRGRKGKKGKMGGKNKKRKRKQKKHDDDSDERRKKKKSHSDSENDSGDESNHEKSEDDSD